MHSGGVAVEREFLVHITFRRLARMRPLSLCIIHFWDRISWRGVWEIENQKSQDMTRPYIRMFDWFG